MEILAKIFEIINNRISLPISFLCALLLFGPGHLLAKIELEYFVSSNRSTIWLFFLFSSILYIYEKSGKVVQLSKIVKRKLDSKRIIKENLDSISPQEAAWVYYCLRENKKTVIATQVNSTAVSLENKHLVYRPDSVYSILETPLPFTRVCGNI